MAKVLFEIEQDSEGYPPVSSETVWAEDLGSGRFRLENSPFYAKRISYGDVVEAAPYSDGVFSYTRLVQPSGHSTVRVVLFEDGHMPSLTRELERLGASWEEMRGAKLLAVDVPPDVAYTPIFDFLNEGFKSDKWDFEEAMIRHD